MISCHTYIHLSCPYTHKYRQCPFQLRANGRSKFSPFSFRLLILIFWSSLGFPPSIRTKETWKKNPASRNGIDIPHLRPSRLLLADNIHPLRLIDLVFIRRARRWWWRRSGPLLLLLPLPSPSSLIRFIKGAPRRRGLWRWWRWGGREKRPGEDFASCRHGRPLRGRPGAPPSSGSLWRGCAWR